MSGYVQAFKKGSPKGWVPAAGEHVLARCERPLGRSIVMLGIVRASSGNFFKVHLWAGSTDFIDGKFVGKSDFEIHELRPAPKGRKREIATVE